MNAWQAAPVAATLLADGEKPTMEMLPSHKITDEEHERLNSYEAFAIGMLQAVAAAATFGVLSTFERLSALLGDTFVMFVVTMTLLSLVTSLCAACLRPVAFQNGLQMRLVAKADAERLQHMKSARLAVKFTRLLLLASLAFLVLALLATAFRVWLY